MYLCYWRYLPGMKERILPVQKFWLNAACKNLKLIPKSKSEADPGCGFPALGSLQFNIFPVRIYIDSMWRFRAFSISTIREIHVYYGTGLVSMPCFGLSPFLQVVVSGGGDALSTCQCPASGFLHSYCSKSQNYTTGGMCQCPASGFLHFYVTERSYYEGNFCVNALLRAFSISTFQVHIHMDVKHQVSMPCFGLSPFLPT